jgi:hypothetical protein
MWFPWLIQYFVTRVLYSPLFPTSPHLQLHQTILIDRISLPPSPEYSGTLLMDYVPNITVTRSVVGDLLLGRYVPGMVRVFHSPRAPPYDIPLWLQDQISQGFFYVGSDPRIQPLLRAYGMEEVVHNQSMWYHLYTNNCWDFVRRCEEHSHTILGKMVSFSDTELISFSRDSRI